ncbi:CBS domain-containing protein [Thioalkalivibrio sp. ALR17-21]|uniref:CBS domain-containing protein n=1 Tax=Thioalkalivibrio sp. ALR17-21 TaxID=1269813 RepID=UPI000410E0CF|nr:CBS domain-containing protein [Thioalkalivibrio sp. ALR17-21]
MNNSFAPIQTRPLSADTAVLRCDGVLAPRVTPESPADRAMTDLRKVPAVTATAEMQADEALQRMIHAGVRLLLVVDGRDSVKGVVTARDIMGERPVKAAQDEGIPRDAVQVKHVMSKVSELEAINLDKVEHSRVGDVVETLKKSGRQHALVVTSLDGGGEAVCGLFSATQVGRQLGVEVSPEGPAQTFAELERSLAS